MSFQILTLQTKMLGSKFSRQPQGEDLGGGGAEAQIYTNFDGEIASRRGHFLVKVFQKCPKMVFLNCYLTPFSGVAINCVKIGFLVFWERSKI